MSILLAALAIAQTAPSGTTTPIEITTRKRKFSCEARDAAGTLVKFEGEFAEWQKHDRNDSGVVLIQSAESGLPAGSYVALARDRDLSFSNYLNNTGKPTRIKLVIGEDRDAIVAIEVKSSSQGKLKPHLYAGFCKGDFAGIGAA